MVAHLSRGKYLLTDKESFERKSSSIGDVIVHAHDKSDFLIFPESTYVFQSSLFVNGDQVRELFPDASEDIQKKKLI